MKLIIKILICIVAMAVVYIGISAYVAVKAINVGREPIAESPEGMSYEDVSFPSRGDQVILRGWYMPRGDSCIIIVNGGWDNRVNPGIGTLELTANLVDRGFSVLLFDQRGRGESEGNGMLLVHAGKDIGGAIDYIKSRGYGRIYLIGFSAGAASSIILATEDGILAIVSDTCFADVHDMLIRGMVEQSYPELFARVFSPGAFLVARVIYGYERVNPVDVVSETSCPILFIHGEADHFIPVENVYDLYRASSNPLDKLWVVPGADHCQAYKTDPAGYINRVTSFFEER